MTIRQTAKWFVAIVLLAGLGAAGYGYLWLTRADEVLRAKLLEKQAELAPDWDVSVGRAHFDWRRRIHIYDVTVKAKGQARPVATFPEVILTVDRETLSRRQEVEVERVRLVRPILDLVRDEAGTWNWQALLTLKPTDKPCPEWEVEQGAANIVLEHSAGGSTRVALRNGDLQLIPSGKREFLVKAAALFEGVGKLQLDGEWDLDAKSWGATGRIADVAAGQEILELAAAWSPQMRTGLLRADAALRRLDPQTAAAGSESHTSPFSVASFQEGPADAAPEGRSRELPAFGIDGTLDLAFRVEQSAPEANLDYKLLADLRQMQVMNAALPFPLHEVQGKVYLDPEQIIIRDVAGRYGTTRVSVDGEFNRGPDSTPGTLQIAATDLPLDDSVRSRLPEAIRKQYDLLHVSGAADVAGTLLRDEAGRWQPRAFELTARNCSIAHARFPYPVTGIGGTITQSGELLKVVMNGRAGRRPVKIIGYVRNPGPTAEAAFEVTVNGLAIDSDLIDACPSDTRKLLRDLRLQGSTNATVTIVRPPGAYREYNTRIVATLNECDMEYVAFPYRLTALTGEATFDSATDVWELQNLAARHGTTQLTGSGTYTLGGPEGTLLLQIGVRGGQFDRHLELALPDTLHDVWAQFAPSGLFNASVALTWTRTAGLSISIPDAELSKAGITLQSLPLPLENVRARLSYGNDYLDVQSFSARYEDAQIRGSGFALIPPAGEWRVRLQELFLDDLVPDRNFRRALPPDLRTIVEELDPRGKFSLSRQDSESAPGGATDKAFALELRGIRHSDAPLTAAWNLNVDCSGGRLRTGIEIEEIYGRVSTHGTWDGRDAVARGAVNLDSMKALGYQLTQVRGPYQLNERGQLIVGSKEALVPMTSEDKARPIPLEDRLSGHAIGGVITLDAAAKLEGEPTYHLLATLSHGRLEEYARRYLQGAQNLAGVMNGWIDLESARGTSARQMKGRGKLQISPAALYELPIVVQMFQALRFTPPDKTAFKYAFLDFEVVDEQFRFNRIDLNGDAISFRGRGTVGRFDGKLDLEFYSMMPQNRLPIPLVKPVVDAFITEATTGWVGIELTGKLAQPVARLKAVPVLDEAIKRFLSAFQPPPPGSTPQFVLPVLPPSGQSVRGAGR